MTRLTVLLLLVLVASCRLDTFFRGSGGGASPVAGPPADLRFVDQPQSGRARNTLPPVRVAVRDDQGNVVAGFGGVVSLALDSPSGGGCHFHSRSDENLDRHPRVRELSMVAAVSDSRTA